MYTITIRTCLLAALAASQVNADLTTTYARPVVALPTNTHPGDTCVFWTSIPQWQGGRYYGCVPPNECMPVKATNLIGAVSSIGPDKDAGVCEIFRDRNCGGSPLGTLSWPGSGDLFALGWDNKANSARCSGV